MTRIVTLFTICLITACALPASKIEKQGFVPRKDLEILKYSNDGLRYASSGRYLDAEVALRKATYLEPRALPIRLNLAIVLREQQQLLESEDILLKLLADHPNSAAVNAALGALYFQLRNFFKARNYFNQAIELAMQEQRYDVVSNYYLSLGAAWYDYAYLEDSICAIENAQNFMPNPNNREVLGKLMLEQANYSLLVSTNNKQGGAGRENVAVKLNEALAEIGLSNIEQAQKILSRIELVAQKKPELLPEIQLLTLLAQSINYRKENNTNAVSLSIFSPEDIEKFPNLIKGIKAQKERLRIWPINVRQELLEIDSLINLSAD
jgi:tetratricopeptide (TPR) repeat protein